MLLFLCQLSALAHVSCHQNTPLLNNNPNRQSNPFQEGLTQLYEYIDKLHFLKTKITCQNWINVNHLIAVKCFWSEVLRLPFSVYSECSWLIWFVCYLTKKLTVNIPKCSPRQGSKYKNGDINGTQKRPATWRWKGRKGILADLRNK